MLAKRLASGGLLRMFSIAIMAAVSLLTMPILIKNLGNQSYGLWVLVYTLVGYCSMVDFGFSRSYQQAFSAAYGKQNTHEIRETLSTGIYLFLVMALLCSVLVLGFYGTAATWVNDQTDQIHFGWALLIIGLSTVVQIPFRIAGIVLYAQVRHDLIIAGNIVEYLTRIGMIVWVVAAGGGLVEMAIITFCTMLLKNFWELHCCRQHFSSEWSYRYFSPGAVYRMFSFAKISFISDTTLQLQYQLIPVFVARWVSLDMVVFVAVAQRLLGYCHEIITAWTGMLLHVFSQFGARRDHERIKIMLAETTGVVAILSGYLLLCILLYVSYFIELWLGSDYLLTVDVIYWLCVPMFVLFFMGPSKECLFGIAKHSGLAWLHGVQLVLVVILSFGFFQVLGFFGIFYGVALAVVPLELVVVPWLVSKHLGVSRREIYGRSLLVFIIFSLLFFGLRFILSLYYTNTFLNLILFNIGQGLLVFPLVVLLFPQKTRNLIVKVTNYAKA